MVADIDSYSPFIRAVFGSAPTGAIALCHFHVGGRVSHRCYRHLSAYFRYRTAALSPEDVLALLDDTVLAARHDQRRSGLRYFALCGSMSQAFAGEFDDDNVRELEFHTGQHCHGNLASTRMLLGYVMESACGEWQPVLPYDNHGLIAELVGHLASLLMQLIIWRRGLAAVSLIAEEWLPVCRDMLTISSRPMRHGSGQ